MVKRIDSVCSSFETKVGVKQGCVLSPIFFNIFLSDLPGIFDSNCYPVKLNNTSLHCLLYADDLIILSESSDGLQCALDKLHQYCLKWKLIVNIDKSNIMIFNKAGRLLENSTFTYGGINIQITKEYCYLGIISVPSGSLAKSILWLKEKASKAYFKIKENLFNSSFKCSLKLFSTLVQPILGYGCEVWAPLLFSRLNDSNFISICDNYLVKLCISKCVG